MMNKIRKGLVIAAMAGLVFSTNAPATQVSAATRNCAITVSKKNCATTAAKSYKKNTTANTKSTFNCGNLKYKVTGKNTVTCTGVKNTNAKSCTIPSKVSCNGKTYTVSNVANNAFANCGNLNKINCSSKIANVGSNCFGRAKVCFR